MSDLVPVLTEAFKIELSPYVDAVFRIFPGTVNIPKSNYERNHDDTANCAFHKH